MYVHYTTLPMLTVILLFQIQTIVGKFGVVVISRFGHNAEEFVYKSDDLFPLKVSVIIY